MPHDASRHPIRLSTATLAVILGLLHVPDARAQRPDDELTWRRRAVAAMAAQDFDAAVAAADRAQAIAPDRSAVQLVVGQAYLSHARDRPSLGAIGKVKKGRAAVERAIALDGNNLEARMTLLLFLLQAPGIVGGNRDEARAQAREIARRDPRQGLLARLEVALADAQRSEILDVYHQALPWMGTASDSAGALMRTFGAATRRIRHKDLRERLRREIDARVGARDS